MGKSCTITAPGLAKMAGVKTSGFDAIAYPNPFANAFEVKVTTASSSPVQVNVYDMTGRLIETRQAKPDSGMSLGGNYASGVYNVIVNQGDEVTTLRVIKR
jgi:hypothetical protein